MKKAESFDDLQKIFSDRGLRSHSDEIRKICEDAIAAVGNVEGELKETDLYNVGGEFVGFVAVVAVLALAIVAYKIMQKPKPKK